jgi:tetratricopeptide (TPR) repeat protein
MLDNLAMWRNAAARAELETRNDPSNAFAWFNLGESLTRLGENSVAGNNDFYQAGAQAFDQARSLNLPPRMLWYQFRPYIAYLKVGRYQDVIDLADATLATQGGRNVEETYWYRGQALEFMGDIAGAREAYQTALQVNSNFYPAQISLDWVNSLGG